MSYKPSSQDYAFVIAGACSLFLGVVLDLSAAEWVIRNATYWVLLVSLVAFLYSLIRILSEHHSALSKKARSFFDGRTAVFLLFVIVAIFALQPSGYKVLMDEPLLVASSRQMHLERELYVPQSCYELGGAFYNFDGYIDKRPGFFPFFLSILHNLTGYRSTQGLVANALLVPIFCILVSFLSDRLWPGRGKYLGPLLILTVPLLSIVANSSGYEFLNLVLLCAILLLALIFYQQPSPAALDSLLWASVLVAHTRYESALYLVPVLLIVVLRFILLRRSSINWLTCLVPLALVPVVLLMRIIGQQEDPLQLRAGDSVGFSLNYFWRNVRSAFEFFFQFGGEQPNSWLLSILVLLAIFISPFALRHYRKTMGLSQFEARPVYYLMGLGLVAYIGTIVFYHWGELSDFAATRFALPIIAAQIFLVVGFSGCLLGKMRMAWLLPLICLIYFALVTVPICLKTDFLDDYPPARRAAWLQSKAREYKEENVLFVAQQRLVPVVEEVSGISIGRALSAKEKLAIHHQIGTFSKIFFVQLLIPDETGKMVEEIPLRAHFKLDELERHRIGGGQEVVLSELKVVHLTKTEKERMDLSAYTNYDLSMDWFRIIPETLP